MRFMPFSLLMMVTVAPGIASPAGSVTEPAIALVVSPCAMARRQQKSAASMPQLKFRHA